MMNTDIQPPEGKKCFSGIPEAHFIDDVDSYMKGEENSEVKMKELDEVSLSELEDDKLLILFCRPIKNISLWKVVLSQGERG